MLGYGGLSVEIVGYLFGLLKKEKTDLFFLFERLEDFYWRWSDGEFIDMDGETLPQWKMRKIKKKSPKHSESLGKRQVDIFAGYNVMICLFELHRYAQSLPDKEIKSNTKLNFHPCGLDINNRVKDESLLLRHIGYGLCVNDLFFSGLATRFLVGVNLSGANLSGANLYKTNLSGANLSGAMLDGAILDGANLYKANLLKANLFGAYLFGVNLYGANLSGVILDGAILYGAHLSRANLSEALVYGAYLDGAYMHKANLSNSYFDGADLSGTDLSGANLSASSFSEADLSGSDLNGGDLSQVDLDSADLSGVNLFNANLNNLSFSDNTVWNNVRGLETSKNIPDALKQQLGLD